MKSVYSLVIIISLSWLTLINKTNAQAIFDTVKTHDRLNAFEHSTNFSFISSKNKVNSTIFSPQRISINNDWVKRNKAYKQHPDADYIDNYAPSPTAIELFEKRTRNSKYYIDKNNSSKQYILQSIGAIHYRKNGQWLTINERLEAKGNNLFEASRQEEPVGFDVDKQTAYIKSIQGTVQCNQWELFGETNGKDTLLAKPDWSNFTAGDEGLYITNIFPNVDAEMKVGRGTIETNFIIHKNKFTNVSKLLFKDIFTSNDSSKMLINGKEVDYIINGKQTLIISEAVAYQEQDAEHSIISLPYTTSKGNTELSISIDVSYLTSHLANGNVIVDPLISTTNSLAQADITGSMDCGSNTNSCNYTLQVPSPAKTTITGIYFQFGFQTVGTALNKNGYWTISSGSGNTMFGSDPTNPTKYNSPGTTSTQGQFADITASFLSAMPAPSCNPQNIPFTLGFFNNLCGAGSTCSNNSIKASQPFIVLIEGYTVEVDSISPTVSICKGANATLNVAGKYGVPPYTYSWSNSAGSTSSVTVAPTVNTSYQVTINDQCGNTATGSVAVTVKPVSAPATPVASSNSPVCEGGTISLSVTSTTGTTYAWTGANGFTSSLQNPTIPNATIDATGTYSVTAFAGGCASVPATINVTVNTTKVAVTIQANATTLCEGTMAIFTVLSTNGGTAPIYQWKVNGTNVGTNSTSFSSTTLKNKDGVNCTMISNAGGCIPTTAVTSNSIGFEAIKKGVTAVGSVVDADGNKYKTVVIGTQEWMAANLNTTRYNDGTAIPNVTDNTAWSNLTTGAYCNYNNLASNATTYGHLYNWFTVNTGKLCPMGWHVPSNNEWTGLQTYLIANGYNYDGTTTDNKIAKAMANTIGWNSYSTPGTIGNNPSSNNKSSFTALPSGWRYYNGTYNCIGNDGCWWSSTEYLASLSYNGNMLLNLNYVLDIYSNHLLSGLSVRCLRDFDIFDYLSTSLAAEPLEICKNKISTLTVKVCSGTAPYSYKWSTGAVTTVPSITVTPTVSTSFIVTVTDAKGKTNSDTVFVTVKQPSSSIITKVVCGSYMLNGQTYTSSGTYTQTFTNKAGCDSTVTLFLTVNKTSTYELARTVCSSYTLNGQTYSTSGTYTQTLTNKAGCDSTITLHLTISNNSPTASTITASACKTYTLNGYLYDSSGTYTQTMKNVEGCDSTITLHLSINATKSSITKTSCGSYSLNGQMYNTSGTFTQTLVNKAGCDSTIQLKLTIINSSGSNSIRTICSGDSCSFNGKLYYATGNYSVHLTNSVGCDSIVTLELFVKPCSKCESLNKDIDGNIYGTLNVGTSVWMTENLKTSRYNDGTPIPYVSDNSTWGGLSTGAYCWANNDSVSYNNKYGKLYNWYTVTANKLCPSGWHLPNYSDWQLLNEYLSKNGNSEFKGISGGDRYNDGSFHDVDVAGLWWVSPSSNGCNAHYKVLVNGNNALEDWCADSYLVDGFSVRCVREYIADTAIKNLSICNGDKYIQNGIIYDKTGTYTINLSSNAGCDSVLILNLNVINPSTNTISKDICGSYTLNGQTYTSSGIYTQKLVNAMGCDSTITLHLTINNITSSTITKMDCGTSFTLNGQTYTASGDFTQVMQNKAGCDSTITLHLTINKPTSSTITETACGSYTLNGKIYTASGTYTQTLKNVAGCDSTITLHLTVNQSSSSKTSITICEGKSYTFNGKNYTASGSYSEHFTNAVGCDSVATLVLQVTPLKSTISASICSGESYLFNGQTYNSSGTYTAHLTNASGCDSTVTLNLNVKSPLVTINSSNLNVCLGETGTYDIFDKQVFDSLVWHNSQHQRLIETFKYTPPNSVNTGIFTYYAIPYKEACKGNEVTYTFTVTARPTPEITGKRELCKGIPSSYILQNTTTNATIEWYYDNDYQSVFDNKQQVLLPVEQTGIHIIKVNESLSGCIGTDTLTVKVSDIPQADFTYNCNAETMLASFTNTSNEVQLNNSTIKNSYLWQFESEETKVIQNSDEVFKTLTHQYANFGDYPVTLWVTNGYGCSDSVTKTIELLDPPSLLVPTAFSPNGDGLNDVLHAKGRNVEDVLFVIYDRWGQKVFESNNLTDGWDGTFKGRALETATFMYYLSATSKIDGKKLETHGNVTLVR